MALKFLATMTTPEVQSAQLAAYGRARTIGDAPERDLLGPDELGFIASRDSFYLATVNADGWPYVQHRGGPAGFLRVLGPNQLGFADFRGNRQLLSTGHVAANGRVALFLMDYPTRSRLKLLGLARTVPAAEDRDLLARVAEPPQFAAIERIFVLDVLGYDWNCEKFITPRYTEEEWAERMKDEG
ncbi:MAG: pyridoxamine 5'-phosphate oxidase family protein [Verrucomicrobia bacterium]|nr:pyridoxamine 5'-phosphate oxidase family protein [Verrucomicrobiota bacterium]